jgi:DNA-binding CsgD family transcriptional regulator
MRSQIPAANRKPLLASRPGPPTAEELFKHLVTHFPPKSSSDDQSSGGTAHETDEVVFDAEIDGFHYFLVRAAKSARGQIALSPRKKEIVRMVAQGHPNKVIAGVLNISSWTVCTHIRRVFAKLGVGSRAAMVARLLEIGTIRSGPHAPQAPEGGGERAPRLALATSASASGISKTGGHQVSASRRTKHT